MSAYQCRMCGTPLPFTAEPVVTCEYCGSLQPFHSVDNEKMQQLFNRANRLRLDCEFDRAAAVYESIAAECPGEPEASWGMVLCRYGIEYVDDPATGKKVPTCHRSSYTSIWDDADCQQTLDCAGPLARKLYHREAARIEELREGILEVSAREDPYDIFICYKETDDRKKRTLDSVLAQDIYDLLTDKGYRVFFSRISLEDKLGREYEPYIFAALNSAKVMLAVGTCFEHYDAVWVKNEWSRFLKLMERDREKYLIPCFKDLDAYDMPREFRRLQAQDLGKVGAHQDLLRGIEKLIAPKASVEPAAQQIVIQQDAGSNADSLVKRGYMALEDGDWKKAEEYFDQALNQDSESAQAYLGLFLASAKQPDLDDLVRAKKQEAQSGKTIRTEACPKAVQAENTAVAQYTIRGHLDESEIRELFHAENCFDSNAAYLQNQAKKITNWLNLDKNLTRAVKFSSPELHAQIEQATFAILDTLREPIRHAELEELSRKTAVAQAYQQHIEQATDAVRSRHAQLDTELSELYEVLRESTQDKNVKPKDYMTLIHEYKKLGGYRDAEVLKKALEQQLREHYQILCKKLRQAHSVSEYEDLAAKFQEIADYADCRQLADQCDEQVKLKQGRGCCIIVLILLFIFLVYVLSNFESIIRSIVFSLF